MINEENTVNSYVMKLNLSALALPSDYKTIYNLLFCRRIEDNDCQIRRLVNNIAIRTRVKRTFNSESEDDLEETFLIFYKFNHIELPRFTNDLISIYDSYLDKHEFTKLNKSKEFHLIPTPVIQSISVPEQYYIKHQIDEFLARKIRLGVVQNYS